MSWKGVKTQLGEVKDAYLDPIFEEPDSLTEILKKIKNKELGSDWWEDQTRRYNALKNLLPQKRQQQIGSILSQTGELFDKAWDDAREFKDPRNPLNLSHNIGAIGARGIEGFNHTASFLAGGASIIAHEGLRLDKPVADLTGNVASIYLTRKLMNTGIGLTNKAIASPTAHNIAHSAGKKVGNLAQRFKPVNQRTVDVKAFRGNQLTAESSRTIAEKYPWLTGKKPQPYAFAYDMSEGGGLLASKSREIVKSQFKNVKEIDLAKIKYQKDLERFRNTELGIQTLEDAYTYYGANRSLSGFKAPPGYAVRPKGKVNIEKPKGLSLVSQPIRDLERIKREFPQQPDESSILPLFQNAVGQDKAPAEVSSYINTSKKIYDEIGKAITRYNKGQGGRVLTKEHIFDVDFHNKLQEIVPDFSGKGANELGNISILNFSLNSSTGARAGAIKDKTVDPETGAVDYPSVTNALIKNVQEGVGVDYKKSVGDFIDYDIGNKVKNLSKEEWDWLLKEIIDSQDTGRTVQDILVESMKKLQAVEDLQFN